MPGLAAWLAPSLKLAVEIQIQQQNIYARLPEEAEVTPFGMSIDEGSNLVNG